MYEYLLSFAGLFLTLIGAAFVGAKLNEGRHRKVELKDKKQDILDLTKVLEKHDRISKEEREALESIPNIKPDDISRVLHEWPEVSGVHKPAKKTKSKNG